MVDIDVLEALQRLRDAALGLHLNPENRENVEETANDAANQMVYALGAEMTDVDLMNNELGHVVKTLLMTAFYLVPEMGENVRTTFHQKAIRSL